MHLNFHPFLAALGPAIFADFYYSPNSKFANQRPGLLHLGNDALLSDALSCLANRFHLRPHSGQTGP